MSTRYILDKFDPFPVPDEGIMDGVGGSMDSQNQASSSLMALDIMTKYQFVDEDRQVFHEYPLPNNIDVHMVGGYVGKVITYRDPALLAYLKEKGVSKETFDSGRYPLLETRSPQLDLLLYHLVRHLRAMGVERPSLFDLGCSVAEHYDMLDTLFKTTDEPLQGAGALISYMGLDISMMLLSIARMLHPKVDPDYFELVKMDGSQFEFDDEEFDLSLSVGVINHVYNPLLALEKILKVTRYASAMALWVTLEPQGYWVVSHGGIPLYFFSHDDLRRVRSQQTGGDYYLVEQLTEEEESQPRSFIGLGKKKTDQIRTYHLVYSKLDELPFPAEVLL